MIEADWIADEVPDWFWALIETSDGDDAKFVEQLRQMPKKQLRDVDAMYTSLAEEVVGSEVAEGKALDISFWIVAQGREFYFDVYEGRRPIPMELTRRGKSVVYRERFGVTIESDESTDP